jgi:hypothetical protein
MSTAAPDPTLARIGEGIALRQRGELAAARHLFAAVWDDVGPDGDPLHRCALAHSAADVEDDPRQELAWDLRALAAVEQLTDERVRAAGMAGSAAAFLPSLHLNLADVRRRLGDAALAREHVERARAALAHLPDDGYRAMIVEGLERVAAALDAPTLAPPTVAAPAPAHGRP